MINIRRTTRHLWVLYMLVTIIGAYIFCWSAILLVKTVNQRNERIKQQVLNQAQRGERKDVNVIVAHYIGSGNLFNDLDKDYANANAYAPIKGEGENGRPVAIPPREILKMQRIFQVNRFNLLASDRIALNRTVPDVRKKKCLDRKYPKVLPDTSVIIVFHNEAWSVLMRTVWSVINRSPRHLLKEILLIDDASDRTFLKESLDAYVHKLPVKTTILRLPERKGLVTARLLGARNSTGKTLTFLDAHCECSPGWLEPLLARVQEDPHKVVCPVIDIISDNNFGYVKSFEIHWGAFNYDLHFRWYLLGNKELNKRKLDVTTPFFTPVMAGGLFTIDKDFFYSIGTYDEELKIWGGDNLEMSFRLWQCGGEIEIVPCSHVGHLFRKSSPYTFPGGVSDVLSENLARVATVWMDEWAEFFFKFNPTANRFRKSINVSSRLQLKESLNCKSFAWYLDTIWPEHFFPADGRFFGRIIASSQVSRQYGKVLREIAKKNDGWDHLIEIVSDNADLLTSAVKSLKDSFCIQRPAAQGVLNQPFGQAFMKRCSNQSDLTEMFVIKDNGHIMTDEGICLDAPESRIEGKDFSMARIITCGSSDRQKWSYNVHTLQLLHDSSGLCLRAPNQGKNDDGKPMSSFDLTVTNCNSDDVTQKWMLEPIPWK